MLLVFSDSDFNCAQWCTFYGTFTVIHSVSFNVEIQGRLCRATETITDYQQKLCGTQPARNRMKVPSSVCFLAGGGGVSVWVEMVVSVLSAKKTEVIIFCAVHHRFETL